jgi:hypothetical protein
MVIISLLELTVLIFNNLSTPILNLNIPKFNMLLKL